MIKKNVNQSSNDSQNQKKPFGVKGTLTKDNLTKPVLERNNPLTDKNIFGEIDKNARKIPRQVKHKPLIESVLKSKLEKSVLNPKKNKLDQETKKNTEKNKQTYKKATTSERQYKARVPKVNLIDTKNVRLTFNTFSDSDDKTAKINKLSPQEKRQLAFLGMGILGSAMGTTLGRANYDFIIKPYLDARYNKSEEDVMNQEMFSSKTAFLTGLGILGAGTLIAMNRANKDLPSTVNKNTTQTSQATKFPGEVGTISDAERYYLYNEYMKSDMESPEAKKPSSDYEVFDMDAFKKIVEEQGIKPPQVGNKYQNIEGIVIPEKELESTSGIIKFFSELPNNLSEIQLEELKDFLKDTEITQLQIPDNIINSKKITIINNIPINNEEIMGTKDLLNEDMNNALSNMQNFTNLSKEYDQGLYDHEKVDAYWRKQKIKDILGKLAKIGVVGGAGLGAYKAGGFTINAAKDLFNGDGEFNWGRDLPTNFNKNNAALDSNIKNNIEGNNMSKFSLGEYFSGKEGNAATNSGQSLPNVQNNQNVSFSDNLSELEKIKKQGFNFSYNKGINQMNNLFNNNISNRLRSSGLDKMNKLNGAIEKYFSENGYVENEEVAYTEEDILKLSNFSNAIHNKLLTNSNNKSNALFDSLNRHFSEKKSSALSKAAKAAGLVGLGALGGATAYGANVGGVQDVAESKINSIKADLDAKETYKRLEGYRNEVQELYKKATEVTDPEEQRALLEKAQNLNKLLNQGPSQGMIPDNHYTQYSPEELAKLVGPNIDVSSIKFNQFSEKNKKAAIIAGLAGLGAAGAGTAAYMNDLGGVKTYVDNTQGIMKQDKLLDNYKDAKKQYEALLQSPNLTEEQRLAYTKQIEELEKAIQGQNLYIDHLKDLRSEGIKTVQPGENGFEAIQQFAEAKDPNTKKAALLALIGGTGLGVTGTLGTEKILELLKQKELDKAAEEAAKAGEAARKFTQDTSDINNLYTAMNEGNPHYNNNLPY